MHCDPPKTKILGPPRWPTRSTLQLPHGVWGALYKLASGVHSRIFAVLYSRKTRLVAAFRFFGQHCNEWRNKSQSRLRSNLVSAGNLRHMNIIVVQTSKLIFVGSKIAPPPPKFCGPVRPNTSNMPKAGPGGVCDSERT